MLILSMLGCFTYGSVQRAETLGKGNREFGVELGAIGAASSTSAAALPNPSFAARFGVGDRVDIGARMGFSAIAFTTKVMFTDPAADGVRLSLAPEIGIFPFIVWFGHVQIPLLIGIPLGGKNELVLGPRVHAYGFGSPGNGSGSAITAGSSLGFAIDLGGLTLFPELTLEYPIRGAVSDAGGGTVSNLLGSDAVIFNFQVGLLFGQKAEDIAD
jgi:hypothetical protein